MSDLISAFLRNSYCMKTFGLKRFVYVQLQKKTVNTPST